MTELEPILVDNSALASVARCSTQALVRYVLGYTTPEEHAALRAGTAFHEAMAVWFRGGSTDDAMATFEAEYRQFAETNVPDDDRLAWPNLARIVRYWFETHKLGQMPFRLRSPELVEVGFDVPLTPPGECLCGQPRAAHPVAGCIGYQEARLVGRLDALVDLHGSPYVWENKTTGRITEQWLGRWRADSQLTGYIEAALASTGVPVVGVIINAVEFSRLPSSNRKCQRHGVRYDECSHLHAQSQLVTVGRTASQVAEWRRTALHLARRYRDLATRWASLDRIAKVRMQGTFNGSCQWCVLADWCAAGRRVDELVANYVHSPWDPLAAIQSPTARRP